METHRRKWKVNEYDPDEEKEVDEEEENERKKIKRELLKARDYKVTFFRDKVYLLLSLMFF